MQSALQDAILPHFGSCRFLDIRSPESTSLFWCADQQQEAG